ncbi:ribonuclease-like 3 [Trachinotus anak]|uniref:ribonuclease-like 3 n=1 Tax=Trachinotus anak TaxID=443729 RepID=UPI0039F22938
MMKEIMRFQVVCLLLVLLSATVFLKNVKDRYEKFIKQHIYENMTADKCDAEMQKRKISILPNGKCKPTNTFVRANNKTVKSICEGKGERYGEMTKSLQRFDIVVCRLKPRAKKPPKCQYSGTKISQKKIIIKCENGYPVHYDGDIDHSEN